MSENNKYSMKINQVKMMGALMLCTSLLCACANEEDIITADGTSKVQLVISAPFNQTPSRAANEGQYVAQATAAELMKSYAVAVTLQGSSKIVAFVTKSGLAGVESAPVDLELRPGNYTVYGFANIPTSYLEGHNIKKGGTIPTTLGDIRTLMPGYGEQALFTVDDIKSQGIPMTSINGQDITVTERVNQTFGIEVRRMMAKLQFDFRNPTPKDLELSSIKVGSLTLNKTTPSAKPFRFMNYEEARNTVDLPSDVLTASPIHTFTQTLTANYDATKDSDGKFNAVPQHSEIFYVLESAAPTTGNSFPLEFDITDGVSTLGDNMRYALTSPNALTLIHRNDWIVIPITIGEWVMDLTALSYPPIGGYPDAKVTSNGENVFEIKFSAPGDIAFYPTIHKYYSAADFFYLNDPNRIKDSSTSISVTGDDIFSVAPTMGTAGEYTATLGTTSGKATVTITTTFYPNYPDKTVEKPFTAIIYVEKV